MGVLDDLRAVTSLPEREVPIYLDGASYARVQHLERDLEAAKAGAAETLAGSAEAREIAQRIEEVREAMARSRRVFGLRAMPRARWSEFIAEHPARPDENEAFNGQTLFPAMIAACLTAIDGVPVEGQFTPAELIAWLDELHSGAFDELADAAWKLNRGAVDVPFSLAAFTTLQNSEPK